MASPPERPAGAPALLPVAQVSLETPSVPDGLRHAEELRGLLLAQLELGLAELAGVVPLAAGMAPAPGLDLWPSAGAQLHGLRAEVTGSVEALALVVTLCGPDAVCVEASARGPREELHLMTASAMARLADWLGRPSGEATQARWSAWPSDDPYAVLLSGRAAASLYGFTPPVPEELIGDLRRDPIRRAALVDPRCPSTAWVLARRELARGEAGGARAALTQGMARREGSPALEALEAALLEAEGRPRAALAAWTDLAARHPRDPRFALPLARAALAAGEVEQARRALEALPAAAREDARALALAVAVADAGPGADELLLARWQVAAPGEAEPVRRRVAALMASGRYAEALALLDDLAARGAPAEAEALELPLALGAADRARALRAAAREGEALAVLLDPDAAGPPPEGLDPAASAWLSLARGRPEEALEVLGPALEAHPWDPTLLELALAAREAAGLDAAALRATLARVDPLRHGAGR